MGFGWEERKSASGGVRIGIRMGRRNGITITIRLIRLRLVHWATLIGLRSFLQPGSPGGAGSYRFGCGEGRRAEPAPTVRGSRPCLSDGAFFAGFLAGGQLWAFIRIGRCIHCDVKKSPRISGRRSGHIRETCRILSVARSPIADTGVSAMGDHVSESGTEIQGGALGCIVAALQARRRNHESYESHE